MAAADPNEQHIRLIESLPIVNGRYTNLNRIGVHAGDGTFSYVFRADDSETKGQVCIKVHKPASDEYRTACFVREAQLLEELNGQGDILPLVEGRNAFQVDLQSGAITVPLQYEYFATELASANLKEQIYGKRLAALRRLEIFGAICRGVQRLHANGICHRDLKPDNCFMSERGVVWVGDLGSARKVDGVAPPLKGEYGQIMFRGDSRYTSPEMVCGLEREELFFRGDFYSLGAILFELFTEAGLYNYVFNLAFIQDLVSHFFHVPVERRKETFDGLLPSLLASRSLPSVRDLPNMAPESIVGRIDRLYQRLSDLDYSTRLYGPSGFRTIFNEIAQCKIILTNERQYLAWKKQRELWRKQAIEKAQVKAEKHGHSGR